MAVDLRDFVLEETLRTDDLGKSCYVSGHFGSDSEKKIAIVKLVLPVPQAGDILRVSQGECIFQNSIFQKYASEMHLSGPVEVIYPATEAMYLKHSAAPEFLIYETRAIYDRIIAPYVNQLPVRNLDWVRNILAGASEVQNVVYRDQDCVVVQDYKVDKSTSGYFYFLALPLQDGLRSLRDLRGEHLPLLRKIRDEGTRAVATATGASGHQILRYIHYHPSFYHFHVHFTPIGSFLGCSLPNAHLLDQVISNLELDPEFYVRATLLMTIRTSHPKYEEIRTEFPLLPSPPPPLSSELRARLRSSS